MNHPKKKSLYLRLGFLAILAAWGAVTFAGRSISFSYDAPKAFSKYYGRSPELVTKLQGNATGFWVPLISATHYRVKLIFSSPQEVLPEDFSYYSLCSSDDVKWIRSIYFGLEDALTAMPLLDDQGRQIFEDGSYDCYLRKNKKLPETDLTFLLQDKERGVYYFGSYFMPVLP